MNESHKITIAVDGYSSCGKSTIARALASRLHYRFVDTGAMYRALTLYAIRNGLIEGENLDRNGLINVLDQISIDFAFNSVKNISEVLLNGENVESRIRQMDVNEWVSRVSAISEVRRKMVKKQQEIGKGKGVVLDGRDIGTVVFPDAELKLFMTADIDIRSQRRKSELDRSNIPSTIQQVKENLLRRDQDDLTREESPLRKADDAVVLDNSTLTPEQQLDFALKLAHERINQFQSQSAQ